MMKEVSIIIENNEYFDTTNFVTVELKVKNNEK